MQQDYSSEMLAAEINGVRQGANGMVGGGSDVGAPGSGRGYGRQRGARQDRHEQVGHGDDMIVGSEKRGRCVFLAWSFFLLLLLGFFRHFLSFFLPPAIYVHICQKRRSTRDCWSVDSL